MSNQHFQYMSVKLTDGDHEFSYNIFLPCSKDGVTDEDIVEFLYDRHNVPEDAEPDECLDEGMYYTFSNSAAGVFHESRDGLFNTERVYDANSDEIVNLKALAPELFYE